jgi:hypothetical protein
MNIDEQLLKKFEEGLDPQHPENSRIKAEVRGYGEISSIFSIAGLPGWVFKRLPLFTTKEEAGLYAERYHRYVAAMKSAGLNLPKDGTYVVAGQQVVLYVAQEQFVAEQFCHRLLHTSSTGQGQEMIGNILKEIRKVREFNQLQAPAFNLSIDGQISNWVMVDRKIFFVDTSTPLFKIDGVEQLDPELLLNSTPGALKWLIRLFFLQEVMDRYYDIRLVYLDLLANLHKEQKPEYIAEALQQANSLLPENVEPLTQKEIDKYYKDDKFTWQLFLFLRKIDRWITNKLLRRQYQFILPGKIKR